MTTITSRKELKNQTDLYVFIKREDMMYVRVDGEYIPKRYFTTVELSRILGKPFFHRPQTLS